MENIKFEDWINNKNVEDIFYLKLSDLTGDQLKEISKFLKSLNKDELMYFILFNIDNMFFDFKDQKVKNFFSQFKEIFYELRENINSPKWEESPISINYEKLKNERWTNKNPDSWPSYYSPIKKNQLNINN